MLKITSYVCTLKYVGQPLKKPQKTYIKRYIKKKKTRKQMTKYQI